MSDKNIIIVGAGLSGLSAAFHLKRDYEIFEKEDSPGGLCRSKNIKGFVFDFGGHLLHPKRAYTKELIKALLKKNIRCLSRNSWVYSFKRFTRYPFQINTFGLPVFVKRECVIEFIKARLRNTNSASSETDFSRWIYRNFGKGIAMHFMIPYNKKFWTVHPKRLTCDWIDNFIPIPTISEVIAGAFRDYPKNVGYNSRFLYPLQGGIGCLSGSFARHIKGINFGMELTKIYPEKRTIEFKNGRKYKYDRLILSIPLVELKDIIQDEMPQRVKSAFKSLKFNSIFNLNLGLKKSNLSDKHWVYFPEKDFIFFRVGFYSNFSEAMAPRGCYSIYAEVSYSKLKPIDKKNVVSRIIADLIKAGLISNRRNIVAEDITDIKYGYILYDRYYPRAIKDITAYLNKNDIDMIGRYGRWRYMTMEDTILDGKDIAKKINLGK